MIRSADLRPGDVLQHKYGRRYVCGMRGRVDTGWFTAWDVDARWQRFIPDADIERSDPDRLWWLVKEGR